MTGYLRRREFITLLGGAAAAWPIAGRAQQPALPVIGFLEAKSADTSAHLVAAFRQGLKEAGFVEGQSVAVEFRWTEGHFDRLSEMAADLVQRRVAVIVAISPNAALAAKAATTTIPIVFQTGSDPVQAGLVTSLSRPGGNLTGVSRLATELMPKLLEVLREALPNAEIAFLVNPGSFDVEGKTREMQVAALALGLPRLHVLNASTEREIDAAFATLSQVQANALVIGQDVYFNSRIEQLAALALRHRVSAIYSLPEFAAAGGMMSYGASLADQYRQVGVYTGRILKGEKPSDLPVQQATRIELVINLKTAKALGLTIPISLLGRADEVIE
jgi:putative ABC transport system substrate-binding protein